MPSEMLRILGRAVVRNVEFCNFDKQATKDAKARELTRRYYELANSASGATNYEIDEIYEAVRVGGYKGLKRHIGWDK